jgi:hypothetical protein
VKRRFGVAQSLTTIHYLEPMLDTSVKIAARAGPRRLAGFAIVLT